MSISFLSFLPWLVPSLLPSTVVQQGRLGLRVTHRTEHSALGAQIKNDNIRSKTRTCRRKEGRKGGREEGTAVNTWLGNNEEKHTRSSRFPGSGGRERGGCCGCVCTGVFAFDVLGEVELVRRDALALLLNLELHREHPRNCEPRTS